MLTYCSKKLEPIMIENNAFGQAHIWLRRDIQPALNKQNDNDQESWQAEEIHFVLPQPVTVDEIARSFDALWQQHQFDDLPMEQRMQMQFDALSQALMTI